MHGTILSSIWTTFHTKYNVYHGTLLFTTKKMCFPKSYLHYNTILFLNNLYSARNPMYMTTYYFHNERYSTLNPTYTIIPY